MRRYAPLILAALVSGIAQAETCTVDRAYEGEARDPESGALLYTERHLLHAMSGCADGDAGDPRRRLVLYRCPDARLFARKEVTYGVDRPAPAFALEDGRFGYREGVRLAGESFLAYVQRDAASAENAATVESTTNLVIDAGFDEFVRAHWDALQRGDTLAVDFLVPSRLDTYRFNLRRIGPVEIVGAPVTQFRLSLGGLIGWFAPDITVSYRDADRRLMRFEGMTNIRADRERNIVARIDFPPAQERREVDPAQWQAALTEPPTDCRPGG